MEDYNVTMSEMLMPASEISEPDLFGGKRSERYGQYEIHDQRRAYGRNAGRRQTWKCRSRSAEKISLFSA